MSNNGTISTIENAVKVLTDSSLEIHWDEYWDTLYTLGPNHIDYAPVFVRGLDAETSFARFYCLDALERIGYGYTNLLDKLIELTKDADYEVRCKAVKLLFERTPHNLNLRRIMLNVAKRRSEHLGLRCKAAFLSFKLPRQP